MNRLSFYQLFALTVARPYDGLCQFFDTKDSVLKMMLAYAVVFVAAGITLSMGLAGHLGEVLRYTWASAMTIFGVLLVACMWFSFSLLTLGAGKGFFKYYTLALWSFLIFIVYVLCVFVVVGLIDSILGTDLFSSMLIKQSQYLLLLMLSILSSQIVFGLSWTRCVIAHVMSIGILYGAVTLFPAS